MATDTERREVARRLREYVDIPDDWWADTYPGFYVEKCVFGDVERHRESELFARLAALIEPSCDRDALLAVANEIEQDADGCTAIAVGALYDYVDRIREALGVSE